MRTVVVNALVEITLPDVLDADGIETSLFTRRAGVKIGLHLELNDVVVRIPALTSPGEIGQLRTLTREGGQVITIKRLVLRQIQGDMLPALADGADADGKNVVFFTVEKADEPVVVEEKRT